MYYQLESTADHKTLVELVATGWTYTGSQGLQLQLTGERVKSKKMAPNNETQVNLGNMNPCVKKMEYAVRGPLVIRASELEAEVKKVRLNMPKL